MGRFKSNDTKAKLLSKNLNNLINNIESNEIESTSIDWTQLLSPYQSQDSLSTLQVLMNKLNVCENIEFDHVCLVLQHYLLNVDFFELFIREKCIDLVIDRFYRNTVWNTNVEWMISEVFKLVTSLCKQEQIDNLLTDKLKVLLQNVFTLKCDDLQNFNPNQSTVLKNLIDTIVNICEIKHELGRVIPIEWLISLIIKTIDKKELCTSLANLMFTISSRDAQHFIAYLPMYSESLAQLSLLSTACCSNNLPFLLLIGSLVNLLLIQSQTNNEALIKAAHDYGHIISSSLKRSLNNNENDHLIGSGNDDSNDDEIQVQQQKDQIKTIEDIIESKLISLELLQSIFSVFLNDKEDDEWLDADDKNNDDECCSEDMDVEDADDNNNPADAKQNPLVVVSVLNTVFKEHALFDAVLAAIVSKNNSIFQKTDKIDHLDNSIKLVQAEACSAYLLLMKLQAQEADAQKLSFLKLLQELSEVRPDADSSNDEKISIICGELLKNCLESISTNEKQTLIDLIQKYFEKNHISNETVTINLCRILTQLLVHERNLKNLSSESKILIKNSTSTLMNLIGLCILKVETKNVYLFAELLDCLIDVYSEDNLKDIEREIKLIEKMKEYNKKFRSMVNDTSIKLNKYKKVIIRTVSDNLEPFIDYKTKH